MFETNVAVNRYIVAVIAAIALASMPIQAAPADSGITFIHGTREIERSVQDALVLALQNASAETNGARVFAVTDVQGAADWSFISIAGLAQRPEGRWSIEDAAWVGLALVVRNTDGAWSAGLKGQPDFATLMALVPDNELDASVRAALLPGHRPLSPDAYTYIFPWQPGKSMYYGSFGVHAGGYAGLGAYKAVDFLSDGDTSAGHAPNMLLASAGGTIDYMCKDSVNTAIRIGSLMYVHIISNTNLAVGQTFSQGAALDKMQTGSFSDLCGWANQQPNWFHVHWMFPDTTSTTGTFQANGWTLTLSDSTWRRGAQTVVPQQWMRSNTIWLLYFPLITIRI